MSIQLTKLALQRLFGTSISPNEHLKATMFRKDATVHIYQVPLRWVTEL